MENLIGEYEIIQEGHQVSCVICNKVDEYSENTMMVNCARKVESKYARKTCRRQESVKKAKSVQKYGERMNKSNKPMPHCFHYKCFIPELVNRIVKYSNPTKC